MEFSSTPNRQFGLIALKQFVLVTLRHPALRTNFAHPRGLLRGSRSTRRSFTRRLVGVGGSFLVMLLLASSASFACAQGNYSVAPRSEGMTTDSSSPQPSGFTPPKPTPTPGPGSSDGESDWKNLGGTDWNTGTNWTAVSGGAPPAAGDVAWFKTAFSSGQPNLSASTSIAGIYFNSTGTSGYDITSSSTSIKLTLTAIGAGIASETSNASAVAIGAQNTSGTNIIDVPVILGATAAPLDQTFFQAGGGTLVINGVISEATAGTRLDLTGTGTYTLNAANTYTGGTAIVGGTLNIGNNSALGTGPFTLAGGTITASGGPRSISNAVAFNASTTIGGANDLAFTGTFTNSANSTLTVSNAGTTTFGTVTLSNGPLLRTLTLTGSGGIVFGGVIQDGPGTGSLTFNSGFTGTATLNGSNTYTGATTISGGTVAVANNASTTHGRIGSAATITVNSGGTLLLSGSGSADRINNAAGISLAGGTLAKGSGVLEGSTSTVGMGALTLNAAGSKIDFTLTAGTLTFTNFVANSQVLSIVGYVGTGSPGGTDQLIFHQNEGPSGANQLSNFDFGFGAGVNVAEQDLTGGFFEIYSAVAVPEPSTWVAAALALGAIAFTQRKRFARSRRSIF
jgi:autotransporter-associated beta strand protein